MAGRTHSQHAIPITFGYKVAVWVDELERIGRHLDLLRDELFALQFGGATGTLASVGPLGLAVRRSMAADLGLSEPAITWHVPRDRFAQLAFQLALIASSLQRAAFELVTLQRTEVGEVAEPFHHGKVGSSTMPHKRNPAISESMWTFGELVKNDVRTALSSLGSLHERDKAVYTVEVDYLPRVFGHTHRMLEIALRVFGDLTVDVERMRREPRPLGRDAVLRAGPHEVGRTARQAAGPRRALRAHHGGVRHRYPPSRGTARRTDDHRALLRDRDRRHVRSWPADRDRRSPRRRRLPTTAD
jgi:3-carboxy-cis,cis-muconate cycloisomerase